MTKEDKELLLKDLCARLPYGVIIHHNDFFDSKYPRPNETLTIGNLAQYMKDIERWDIKPYLRPMSSMTEEENREASSLLGRSKCLDEYGGIYCYNNGESVVDLDNINLYYDWLNSHHFDYHGLIEKGLALEAPDGMYETK